MRITPFFTTASFSALVTLGLIFNAPTAWAETTGIATLFADSFDPVTFIPIDQLSGAVPSPGSTQGIIGSGSMSVSITSPHGETTSENSVDVMGTIVGPVNTGITVNGVVGYSVEGVFLVPHVPLTANTLNTLSVTATKLNGDTVTAFTTITQSGASLISLQADHAVGFAPLAVTFTATIDSLPNSVQSIALDFNGDNVADSTSTILSELGTRYTYNQTGLYTARLTVTDSQSITYTAYRSVLIQDLSTQRGMLADVYGYVKERLSAQDAAGAALAYQPVVQNNYLNLFNALGVNMPAAAQQLGTIVNGFIGNGFAELLLVRDNADQTRSGYPLRMTQGSDGVWRISEM